MKDKLEKFFLLDGESKQMQKCVTIDGNLLQHKKRKVTDTALSVIKKTHMFQMKR